MAGFRLEKSSFISLKLLLISYLYFLLCRPGRLTDGPYTSYDLNTLLKATAGQRRAVLIGQGTLSIFNEHCIDRLQVQFLRLNYRSYGLIPKI